MGLCLRRKGGCGVYLLLESHKILEDHPVRLCDQRFQSGFHHLLDCQLYLIIGGLCESRFKPQRYQFEAGQVADWGGVGDSGLCCLRL